MGKTGDFITRHRNLLLVALTVCTIAAATWWPAPAQPAAVTLPVTDPVSAAEDTLEAYRLRRDQDALKDMEALESIVAQTSLDESTRQSAANQLKQLVDFRQKQTALEGALLNSRVSPCVAVMSQGGVTIVTEKTDLSDSETTLILTLANLHADVSPGNVWVITLSGEK